MAIDPPNWLNPSHQKWRSRPTWGSRTIINELERITIHLKTRHPRLLLTRPFRTIHEKLGTKGHPAAVFLRLLPPQNTPHDCSHAHQMELKTHPSRENRPQCCILTRLRKCANCVHMHCSCRKPSLSLHAYSFRHHTRNSRIHHHKWGSNIL